MSVFGSIMSKIFRHPKAAQTQAAPAQAPRATQAQERLAQLVPATAERLAAYPDCASGEQVPVAVLRAGDVVTLGQVIGYAGSTGFSSGPHLHFALQVNGGGRLVSVPFRMIGPDGFLPLR